MRAYQIKAPWPLLKYPYRMPINLLIADDHPLIVEGLRKIFESEAGFNIVATASNGLQALEIIKKNHIDIALLDINMPGMDGIACAKEIVTNHKNVKVAILSMYQEPSITAQLMRIGVKAYVLKTISSDELIMVLNLIYEGKEYFNIDVTKNLISNTNSSGFQTSPNNSVLLHNLTAREKEILICIAKGFTNVQIGEKLFISSRTVDTNRTNIMKKLDLHNIASLIRFAFQNGLSS